MIADDEYENTICFRQCVSLIERMQINHTVILIDLL